MVAPNDQRTPLARAKGLGAAHSGVEHWWAQRWTAVLNIPCSLFMLWWLLDGGAALDRIQTLAYQPLTALGLTLSMGFFGYHGFLGLQVVVEDYVPTLWVRAATLILLRGAFLALFLMSLSWSLLP